MPLSGPCLRNLGKAQHENRCWNYVDEVVVGIRSVVIPKGLLDFELAIGNHHDHAGAFSISYHKFGVVAICATNPNNSKNWVEFLLENPILIGNISGFGYVTRLVHVVITVNCCNLVGRELGTFLQSPDGASSKEERLLCYIKVMVVGMSFSFGGQGM